MLEIDVVLDETYDEKTSQFIANQKFKVRLEHSLVSLSKWESAWEVPFLGKQEKTNKQTLSYVELMLVDNNIPPDVFQKLLDEHLEEIMHYVAAPMSATKLRDDSNAPGSREIVTSELIYYWMISMQIPVEFEHWHLNRLMTLIRVINLKNTPAKKMSNKDRRDLNRARLAQYKTRG